MDALAERKAQPLGNLKWGAAFFLLTGRTGQAFPAYFITNLTFISSY